MSRLHHTRQWLHLRWRKRVIHPLYRRLYRDTAGDTRRALIVAGAGRSGTTWLANVISSQIPCRVMFEPFHSRYVPQFQRYNYFQYVRPEEDDPFLEEYCRTVLSGSIRHAWIDKEVQSLRPQYRLIKEIRANLFLQWLHNRFPEVPLIFMLRHPCAVVLSRMELAWATDGDIAPFLAQPKLIADFLGDRMEVVERARTPEEKHAIVWCVSNLVPLTQFPGKQLNVVFYESLCADMKREIPRVFRLAGHECREGVFDIARKPSSTTRASSAVMTGEGTLRRWQKRLSGGQIDRILRIVAAFDLDHLYGDRLEPLSEAVSRP